MIEDIEVSTSGQGLYEITGKVQQLLAGQVTGNGLCTLYIQHTSASLLIQENADPAVLNDLSSWFCRMVREDDPHYTHTQEGPDDMPAHIKSTLIGSSVQFPIHRGRPRLGTWQGIFLCEHRNLGGSRTLVITAFGESNGS